MFGKCKGCEILKQENAYLRKFIDSLLSKLNMQQIEIPPAEILGAKEPGEEEIKLGPHAERFGISD